MVFSFAKNPCTGLSNRRSFNPFYQVDLLVSFNSFSKKMTTRHQWYTVFHRNNYQLLWFGFILGSAQTYGHNTTDRPLSDIGIPQGVYITSEAHLSSTDVWIHWLQLYSQVAGPQLRLQVWRPKHQTSNNTQFELSSQTTWKNMSRGKLEFNVLEDSLVLRQGDRIGFSWVGGCPVPYNADYSYCPEGYEPVRWDRMPRELGYFMVMSHKRNCLSDHWQFFQASKNTFKVIKFPLYWRFQASNNTNKQIKVPHYWALMRRIHPQRANDAESVFKSWRHQSCSITQEIYTRFTLAFVTIGVWEWISNFIPHFTRCVITCWE